jgi:hypothetical protein
MLDELISRSASKMNAEHMDSFFKLDRELLESPDMKDLRIQKTFSLNNKNDYEKMRDVFFEKKRTGTLKLNK